MNPTENSAAIRELREWRQHLATAFPLLTRELIQQSGRKRMYVLRTIYAASIYGILLWEFWSELGSWSNSSFQFLGRGSELFEAIAWMQFCGLYLFLPAMTSGVLTVEKERDTLGLLLLTRLGPWSILFGKLLGRVVPMATFMMLSLPMVAVAYSLGGVEVGDILNLAWSLFVTSLQIGALALACSAWCRTTAAAFVSTYLVGTALILGPVFLLRGGGANPFGILDFASHLAEAFGVLDYQDGNYEQVLFVLFGPWLCLHPQTQGSPLWRTVLRSQPILLFTGTCLIFARVVIWRRAFVQPSNLLLKMFRRLDKLFHRMNENRLTRGIVLTQEDVALPVNDPIRWRETKKRSLGTTRYLVRFLLLLEIPVLFGMLWTAGGMNDEFAPAYVSAWFLWVVAALVLVIQSTGLIGLERSRQTLDVLLTIPMTSDRIVREKFAGVRRMIRMLWIPFATVYIFQVWWGASVISYSSTSSDVLFGIVRGLLATMIYLPLIALVGFYFGMRCRSQTQAVLVTLSLITGICAIPLVIANVVNADFGNPETILYDFTWLSPATAITAHLRGPYGSYYYQYGSLRDVDVAWKTYVWVKLITHFTFYGALLLWLWSRGLKSFPRYVQRNDGQVVDDGDIERLARLRQKVIGSGGLAAGADNGEGNHHGMTRDGRSGVE